MDVDTVQHLGVEDGERFLARQLETSSEAKAICAAMTERGLRPQFERTHVFSVFSPESLASVAIAITPFNSRDGSLEGGLSVSEGGHAQGVIVSIEENVRLRSFTHFAVAQGKVVTSEHSVEALVEGRDSCQPPDEHIRRLAEDAGKITAAGPLIEIEARQVRSMASVAYNNLLGDSFSRAVHTEEEITQLRTQSEIVAEIGLFVLFRTSGSACCSCSCSCWGSSSCSTSST
jgi:hypothetical protein